MKYNEETIREILKGIDQTETESTDGWWETSYGAKYGQSKLQELLEYLNIENELEDTDTAIVLDANGNLKTLLLPNLLEEAEVPENIVKIIDFLLENKPL
jgi:hypothetical protein